MRIAISLGSLNDDTSVKFEGEIYQLASDSQRLVIRVKNKATMQKIMFSIPFEAIPLVFVNECYDSYRISFRKQECHHIYIGVRKVKQFNIFRL